MARILVVDDDELVRLLLCEYLQSANHQIDLAAGVNSAVKMMAEHVPDLVITDLIMPGESGLELVKIIKKNYVELPVIAISGGGRQNSTNPLVEATTLGADAVLEKPITLDKLLSTVAMVLNQHQR